MAQRRSRAGAAALGLLEVRRILEAGPPNSAPNAAATQTCLLTTHVAEWTIAADGASTFARAETAFHETIVRSCGNVFINDLRPRGPATAAPARPDRNHRPHPGPRPKPPPPDPVGIAAGSPAAARDAMRTRSTSSLKTCCATSSTAAVSATVAGCRTCDGRSAAHNCWAAAGLLLPRRGRHHHSHASDELLHPFIHRLERVRTIYGALRLVVEPRCTQSR